MNALLAPRPQRLRTPFGFIAVALVFYLVDGWIVRSSLFATGPDAISAAVSFDLTFGVTLAWWVMVVRPGNARRRTIIPVFGTSIIAAMLTLPPGHRDLLPYFRFVGIPFELALMAMVFVGVRQTNRRLAAGLELDVPERIRTALGDQVAPKIADIVAIEGAVLFYAFAAWRRKPFVPSGATAFSYHKKNGYAALLYTIARVSLMEMIALDFLLRVHHPTAANIFLAVDLLTSFWLLGLARAVQLRPILVTRDLLMLRLGLQWKLDVPRANVASLEVGRVKAPPKRTPGYLRMAPQPNAMLTLREPMIARGPYGMSRRVTRIGLSIDDIKGFEAAVPLA